MSCIAYYGKISDLVVRQHMSSDLRDCVMTLIRVQIAPSKTVMEVFFFKCHARVFLVRSSSDRAKMGSVQAYASRVAGTMLAR